MRQNLAELFRDREIWVFLVSIVLINTAFVHSVSEGVLPMGAYNHGRFLLLGAALAGIVFLFRGWKAPFALLKPLTVWRVHPGWLLLAVGWPPFIALVTLVGKGLLSGNGLSEVSATLHLALRPDIFFTVLLAAFIGEVVWVGYAIARLSRSTTMLSASVMVGIFWSLWWLPIVLIGIGVVPGIPVFGIFVNMIGVAIMCGFIYAHTRSGLMVLALQLSMNNTLLIFPVAPESGGVPTFLAITALYLVASLALHVIWGPRPLLPGAK